MDQLWDRAFHQHLVVPAQVNLTIAKVVQKSAKVSMATLSQYHWMKMDDTFIVILLRQEKLTDLLRQVVEQRFSGLAFRHTICYTFKNFTKLLSLYPHCEEAEGLPVE